MSGWVGCDLDVISASDADATPTCLRVSRFSTACACCPPHAKPNDVKPKARPLAVERRRPLAAVKPEPADVEPLAAATAEHENAKPQVRPPPVARPHRSPAAAMPDIPSPGHAPRANSNSGAHRPRLRVASPSSPPAQAAPAPPASSPSPIATGARAAVVAPPERYVVVLGIWPDHEGHAYGPNADDTIDVLWPTCSKWALGVLRAESRIVPGKVPSLRPQRHPLPSPARASRPLPCRVRGTDPDAGTNPALPRALDTDADDRTLDADANADLAD